MFTFTTDAYADITMFGNLALAKLKMMGHGATVHGEVLAADVHTYQSRLNDTIEAEKASPSAEINDAEATVVSMADRALPLINLLATSAKTELNVMWK